MPKVILSAPIPKTVTQIMPTISVPAVSPIPSAKLVPGLPSKLLFREVKVSVETLKITSPQTFRNVVVSVKGKLLANFRGVTADSVTSLAAPSMFTDIRSFSEIQQSNT